MPDSSAPAKRTDATSGPSPAPQEFEVYVERRPPGLVRRLLTTWRHFLGMLFGGLWAYLRSVPKRRRRGLGFRLLQLIALLARPFVSHKLVKRPLEVQLRKRLEMLGPTYIKLGQILSLREDILPRQVTDELKNLLDRLPALHYRRYVELVEQELGRPVDDVFAWVDPRPLGSASIGQIHRATMIDGESVILKVVKPGIRQTLERDVVLLKILGSILQLLLPRFQPRRVIDEFSRYTLREVDLRKEADNAETFTANFDDLPEVVFPKIHREYTTRSLLVMEHLGLSRREVKRLVRQGAIEVDGVPLKGTSAAVGPGSVIRVGKRRFLRIVDADKQD